VERHVGGEEDGNVLRKWKDQEGSRELEDLWKPDRGGIDNEGLGAIHGLEVKYEVTVRLPLSPLHRNNYSPKLLHLAHRHAFTHQLVALAETALIHATPSSRRYIMELNIFLLSQNA
jgi:hypothetical protein